MPSALTTAKNWNIEGCRDRPGAVTYEPLCMKEYQLSRVVLDVNQWNFLDYYVRQTLDYCRRSKILNDNEIAGFRTTRIEKYKTTKEGQRPWVKFQSFAKNLNEAILLESPLHRVAVEFF